MIYNKASRRSSSGLTGTIVSASKDVLLGAARLVLSLAMLAVICGVIVFIRLTEGPVVLPGLSRYLVERANATSETIRVEVRTAVLNLGDGSGSSGLEFHDVRVASPDGTPLFTVPRLRASFDFGDLVRGLVRPTRISVIAADAQFIRMPDGRIRFGLGGGDGVSLASETRADTTEAGSEALSKLLDGIVGDSELAPEMSRLRLVEIVGARIVFRDRMAGGQVMSRRATLRVRRDAGGATASLDVAGAAESGEESIWLIADRRKGAGKTSLVGRFERVHLNKLAGFLPALRILDDVDALAEGELSATFNRDGWPTDVSGRLASDGGTLTIAKAVHPFTSALVKFEADLARGTIEITEARTQTPNGKGHVTGVVGLAHGGNGMVTGVRAQIDVEEISLPGGALFEEATTFDHGQIVAAWTPEGSTIEIADSWLGQGGLGIRFSGRILLAEDGLATDLRATTETITVQDLIRLWPTFAAVNARTWIVENISTGRLHDLTAQLRLRPGSEVLALNAGFSGLTSTYIDGMSPIRDGVGDIQMTLDEMHLRMRSAIVKVAGQTIALDDSSMIISGLNDPVTPADIRLTARGATAAVLSLIDQPPLRLVKALGLQLDGVGGDATVTAKLKFPLLAALRVRDVEVDTRSDLRNTRLRLAISDRRSVEVRADRLSILADVDGMRLRGGALVDGTPLTLDWRENYAKRTGRRSVRLAGTVTPELLRNAGLGGDMLTGRADVTIDLTQRGSEPMTFALDADLKRAGLTVSALEWSKAPGSPGHLKASGRLGSDAKVDSLDLEAPGLSATGEIAFWPDGRLRRGLFRRVLMPGRIDAGVIIQVGQDGIPDIRIVGSTLDVSDMLKGDDDGDRQPPQPMRLRLELGRLKVTESVVIHAAAGDLSRAGDGTLSGRITGALGPDAPVSIDLKIPVKGDGRVTLKSPNAGAALRHADIYRGATGGELHVEARIPSGKGTAVTGQARIYNVTVRSQSTFRNVLKDGGLKSAGDAVSGSGLSFQSISVPFRYDRGIVTVTDAIAVSPMLGLKMTGTLDEKSEAIDLIGVLSPAYALTGALNEIPLLGQILSGGRGEGIVGMTFTLKGAMRDPRFTVNPLSLLAPGFLRKLFTGRVGDASSDFKPQGSQKQR